MTNVTRDKPKNHPQRADEPGANAANDGLETDNHNTITDSTSAEADKNNTDSAVDSNDATTADNGSLDELPFAALRMSQDFVTALGITEKRVVLPRKPGRDWFRVHPSEANRGIFGMLDFDGEFYLAHPGVAPLLQGDIRPRLLVLCVTSYNEPFLWPVPLSPADRQPTGWHLSAELALVQAVEHWVRLQADRNSYRVLVARADGQLANTEPKFPTESFEQLVREAFRERFIADVNHPIVKRLQGR